MFKIILSREIVHYPIRGSFTISRGSKQIAELIVCSLRYQKGPIHRTGRGECVPYARYGETLETVLDEIDTISPFFERACSLTFENSLAYHQFHREILSQMRPGAARNAIDCALWDLHAKLARKSIAELLTITPTPLLTAFTLSLATADSMYQQAKENAFRPLLKIKLGRDGDCDRIKAVRRGAPNAKLIIDANEGWNKHNFIENYTMAQECGICLIEQPLPTNEEAYLQTIAHPVPICADESLHITKDLIKLTGLYEYINIKLDKSGGLTEALHLKNQAQKQGFKIMVGCMLASSLAMAPAFFLAQDADFVDLDGPLLLAQDCAHAISYVQQYMHAPSAQLWG